MSSGFQTDYFMKPIIFFASGRGSNVKAIIDYFAQDATVKPALIVCNKPGAGVLDIAVAENIPVHMVDKHTIKSQEFLQLILSFNPAMLVLAGFLWKIPDNIVQAFPDKIINIHPALLPKYGGKGMYGQRVHEAVKSAGDKETGITIHYVNERYDEGDVILQAYCKIQEEDSVAKIAAKIHRLEHFYFPRVIAQLLAY